MVKPVSPKSSCTTSAMGGYAEPSPHPVGMEVVWDALVEVELAAGGALDVTTAVGAESQFVGDAGLYDSGNKFRTKKL